MRLRWIAVVFIVLCSSGLFDSHALAQGGWRQWDIYLRDGSKVEANPLSSTDDDHVGTALKNDAKPAQLIKRSAIDYIAAQLASPPPLPSGTFDQDLVVMTDGRRTLGRVTLKAIEFSEGTIVQNGTQLSLKDVAYIKFAKPANSSNKRTPRRRPVRKKSRPRPL